jgi:hypothetical protein
LAPGDGGLTGGIGGREDELELTTENFLSLDLVLDDVRNTLKMQMDDVSTANTKAQSLIGFTGIAVAALGIRPGPPWLPALWAVPVVLTLYFAFRAYRTSDFLTHAKPRHLWDHQVPEKPSETRRFLLEALITYTEHNEPIIRKKNRMLGRAMTWFLVTVCMLVLSAFVPQLVGVL